MSARPGSVIGASVTDLDAAPRRVGTLWRTVLRAVIAGRVVGVTVVGVTVVEFGALWTSATRASAASCRCSWVDATGWWPPIACSTGRGASAFRNGPATRSTATRPGSARCSATPARLAFSGAMAATSSASTRKPLMAGDGCASAVTIVQGLRVHSVIPSGATSSRDDEGASHERRTDDVGTGPGHGGGDIAGTCGPRVLWREAVVDRDRDHCVFDGPPADVVVVRQVRQPLVAADETAAGHVQHDRGAGRRRRPRSVHVEPVPGIRAVGEVAVDVQRAAPFALRRCAQRERGGDRVRCGGRPDVVQFPHHAKLVADGLSNPDIAALLVLSRRTVQTHISHILVKLRVRSRVDIAREVFAHNGGPGVRP